MPTELQAKILANTRQLHKLATMIDRMPKCEARVNLEKQHSVVLRTLSELCVVKDMVLPDACDYGFADKCPGYHCSLCPQGSKVDG